MSLFSIRYLRLLARDVVLVAGFLAAARLAGALAAVAFFAGDFFAAAFFTGAFRVGALLSVAFFAVPRRATGFIIVNASSTSAACSATCLFARPVAGEAAAERPV